VEVVKMKQSENIADCIIGVGMTLNDWMRHNRDPHAFAIKIKPQELQGLIKVKLDDLDWMS
jgi:hypothetical protein